MRDPSVFKWIFTHPVSENQLTRIKLDMAMSNTVHHVQNVALKADLLRPRFFHNRN